MLLTKISNHSINHMMDSKHLAIVNIFAHLKKFTKARFDYTSSKEKLTKSKRFKVKMMLYIVDVVAGWSCLCDGPCVTVALDFYVYSRAS